LPKTVQNYSDIEGKGIKGDIEGVTYYGGNNALASSLGFCEIDKINALAKNGETPLVFASNSEILGIISVKDTIKQTSVYAIDHLKKAGVKVVLLTGDNKRTATAVANEVGISEVISDVLPSQKGEFVKSLQRKGEIVAMVGDGVNDAPALTVSDVGVAIGKGAEVAVDSADVVLVRNDLSDVYNVIALSKRTVTTIKLCLFWAFFYNLIGIVIASGIFAFASISLTPEISALAMSFSSVCVVTTALTINLFKPKRLLENATINEKITVKIENISFEKMEEKTMKTIQIKVEGMMCPRCEKHVVTAVKKVDGVLDATASHESGLVTISFETEVSERAIKEAIIEAGYEA
jgi:cation transport ATPase